MQVVFYPTRPNWTGAKISWANGIIRIGDVFARRSWIRLSQYTVELIKCAIGNYATRIGFFHAVAVFIKRIAGCACIRTALLYYVSEAVIDVVGSQRARSGYAGDVILWIVSIICRIGERISWLYQAVKRVKRLCRGITKNQWLKWADSSCYMWVGVQVRIIIA